MGCRRALLACLAARFQASWAVLGRSWGPFQPFCHMTPADGQRETTHGRDTLSTTSTSASPDDADSDAHDGEG